MLLLPIDAFWLFVGAFLSLEMAAWKGSFCGWALGADRLLVSCEMVVVVGGGGRLDGAFRKTWSKPVLFPICWFRDGISEAILTLRDEGVNRKLIVS